MERTNPIDYNMRESFKQKIQKEDREFGNFIRGLRKLTEGEIKQLNEIYRDIERRSNKQGKKELLSEINTFGSEKDNLTYEEIIQHFNHKYKLFE